MRNSRPYTGYHRYSKVDTYPTQPLGTNLPIKDEIFASLEYISEVNTVSLEFISKFGHTKEKAKEIQPRFKAFIRQSKTFYDSAELLHHRASPLLYYYSFLNLAKAFLCLHQPNFVGNKIHHGLNHSFTEGSLKKQNVNVTDGVFRLLYEQIYGNSLPTTSKNTAGTKINVIKALAYSSDIAFEYKNANYGDHRQLRVKYRLIQNQQDAYALIAVEQFSLIENYKKSLTGFNKFFEEVDLPKNSAKDLFDFYAENKQGFRFFESIKTYPVQSNYRLDIADDCMKLIKNLYVSSTYSDGIDFSLALPLSKTNQLAFNEFFGIYTGMFFLGSLVRYHQYYLEDLLASKDAWIIERFARSAPLSLLLSFSNHIHRTIYLYTRR